MLPEFDVMDNIVKKVNAADKLTQIKNYWEPHIVAELNGQNVKLAKLKGEFIWHKHDEEDEMFYILKGELRILLRDREVILKTGEFIVIPKGVEHMPVAEEEVHVMLFEPATTLNTGDAHDDILTQHNLNKI